MAPIRTSRTSTSKSDNSAIFKQQTLGFSATKRTGSAGANGLKSKTKQQESSASRTASVEVPTVIRLPKSQRASSAPEAEKVR
jgi:hypothetical protein